MIDVQEYFFRLRSLTEKARAAYAELVASVEQELADQLSDSDDNKSAASHSRSPSAHSVQSRAYSEPEPNSDWLLLDDVSASRGYSSECETQWVDAADDTEDESMQPNDFAPLWHSGAQNLNSSPVTVRLTDDTGSNDFTQDLIDLGSGCVASVADQNLVICDSVKPTVVKDAFTLSGDGSNSW